MSDEFTQRLIAVATQTGEDGRVQEALCQEDSGISVVCSRVDGTWEPLHALNAEGGLIDLPSCFSLGDDVIEELDRMLEATEAQLGHDDGTGSWRSGGDDDDR